MGKIYKSENHIVLLQMIEIYRPEVTDWMQYQITRRNILTLHHIRKTCEGEISTINNGAILTKKAHRILNMVETIDWALYREWNELFMLINQGKRPPCEEYVSEGRRLKKYTQKIVY